jgi:hypothetical protein
MKTARGVKVELVGRDCLSDLRNGQRTGRGVLHRRRSVFLAQTAAMPGDCESCRANWVRSG